MEVDEQVERLVRHTHVRNEDGSLRQLGRVVIGSVPKGTLALFWLKYVGLVGHHVQEGVCNRLVAAKGVNEESRKRHAGKMEKKNCVCLAFQG